jgi:hypothetical protein
MNTYLVRLKRDRELVGLFVSPSRKDLWDFVDECTESGECEYLELPPGGFYFPQAGAPVVPTLTCVPEVEDSFPDWFAGAVLSELWDPIFYTGDHEGEWQPVVPGEDTPPF